MQLVKSTYHFPPNFQLFKRLKTIVSHTGIRRCFQIAQTQSLDFVRIVNEKQNVFFFYTN